MDEFIVREFVDENGEEIIELDLNRSSGKKRTNGYANHMDEVDTLTQKPRKAKKDFMCVIE